MASPVEFRYYLRKYTLEDAEQNIQPLRIQSSSGKVVLYRPPELQFRHKERLLEDGQTKLIFTEWITVAVVREGDEDALDTTQFNAHDIVARH